MRLFFQRKNVSVHLKTIGEFENSKSVTIASRPLPLNRRGHVKCALGLTFDERELFEKMQKVDANEFWVVQQ